MDEGLVAVFHDPALAGGPDFTVDAARARDGLLFILDRLGLDIRNGNPLGSLVSAGDCVVVKPNLVSIQHHHFDLSRARQACVTTDIAIVGPMIEFACAAVGKTGKVLVVDSPIEASDFAATMRKLGVDRLVESFRSQGHPVELLDLRDSRVVPVRLLHDLRIGRRSLNVGVFRRKRLAGDPLGYKTVDLGDESAFTGHDRLERLRFYRPHYKAPTRAHNRGMHRYSIGKSVLQAKLVINLPKMKCHKLSGVTLALKNTIGLLNQKMWLPHYTQGWPPRGDQYDARPKLGTRFQNWVRVVSLWGGNSVFIRYPMVEDSLQQAEAPMYNGSWIGNDTLWRTVADVARLVEYADANGEVRSTPQRTVLSVLDGVIAGEGDGPIGATPKHCGVLAGSLTMHSLDAVVARMMGMDVGQIGYLRHLNGERIPVVANVLPLPEFRFQPPLRWEALLRDV